MDDNLVKPVYLGRWSKSIHCRKEFLFLVASGLVWRIRITGEDFIISTFDPRLGVTSASPDYVRELPLDCEEVRATLMSGDRSIYVQCHGMYASTSKFFIVDTDRVPIRWHEVEPFAPDASVMLQPPGSFFNRFCLLNPEVYANRGGNIFFQSGDGHNDLFVLPMGFARKKWEDTTAKMMLHFLPKDLAKMIMGYIGGVSIEAYEARCNMPHLTPIDAIVRDIVRNARLLQELGEVDVECGQLEKPGLEEMECKRWDRKKKQHEKELAQARRRVREYARQLEETKVVVRYKYANAEPLRQKRMEAMLDMRRKRKALADRLRDAKRRCALTSE